MKSLYKRLTEYGQSDYYGFHMPGHKRNENMMGNRLPYNIDITEIDGFDDLHHAKDILKEAQERAAKVYHAEETCYLINGSTSGILSAVLGCAHKGGRILMARNCHKSVYAAAYMNELEPFYIYPEYDEENGLNGVVEAEKIKEILEADRNAAENAGLLQKAWTERDTEKNSGAGRKYSKIQAIVITSPTYDGVVSDVKAIAEVAHEFGIPLIVDEAHGAHFGFHPYFPGNANQQGADVVIHSLHKTLPSLTQTALLHMNGNLVNRARIRKYVHMLQTSSPSYVLMASMDECIRFLEECKAADNQEIQEENKNRKVDVEEYGTAGRRRRKQNEFAVYAERLDELRSELRKLKHLHLVETENYDRSKIVISTRGTVRRYEEVRRERRREANGRTAYTGKMLYEELLDKYHLQMEMASREYVLAMTSVCDTEEGFARLKDALFEIDEQLMMNRSYDEFENAEEFSKADVKICEDYSEGVGVGCFDYKVKDRKNEVYYSMELPHLEMYCTSAQADVLAEQEEGVKLLPMEECSGKISLEYAYVYPPGIPMIVPGERISEEAVQLLEGYGDAGFDIEGLEENGKVRVLTDEFPES